MKYDTNPDVIFLMYTIPGCYEMFLEEAKKRNIGVREIKLVSCEIPMEHYNETINWFKEFVMTDYWNDRNPLNMDLKMMGFDIKQKLLSHLPAGYKPINIKNANWKNYVKHDLLYTLALPLFYQDQTKTCETQEEKDNMKRLETFDSDGYLNDKQKERLELQNKIHPENEEDNKKVISTLDDVYKENPFL